MKPDPKQTARFLSLLAKHPEGLRLPQIIKAMGSTPKQTKLRLTEWRKAGVVVPLQLVGTCFWMLPEHVQARREAQLARQKLTDAEWRRKRVKLIEVSGEECETVQRSMVAANEAAPIRTMAARWVFEWRPAA